MNKNSNSKNSIHHNYENNKNNKSVLVVGAVGQIGSALIRHLQKNSFNVEGTTHKIELINNKLHYLDLKDISFNVNFSNYESVVICASVTNITKCQTEPELCEKINYINTIALIEKCIKFNCFVVYLSSNAVFDGKKSFYKYYDKTSPANKYGQFKLMVEKYIQNLPINNACILRLTKVITPETSFIQKWRIDIENGNEVKAFSNVFISPVEIEYVVDTIQLLIDRKISGIFQLGGSEELSYFEYANKIFHTQPNIKFKIVPIMASDFKNYNSLTIHLPTREHQYGELLNVDRVTMGLMSGHAYLSDPKRLTFTFARYKFVSKMFSGFDKVLEIGCADAFASPLVSEEVNNLVACDFDKVFIDDVSKTHPYGKKIKFISHNIVDSSLNEIFDGAYALDVLEHIEKKDEHIFMSNIIKSLTSCGSCIIGMPSTESQLYASEISKLGHVNCKTGPELKNFLLKYFENVFIFSMNDEVIHTGFTPMAHYLLALCCQPRLKLI